MNKNKKIESELAPEVAEVIGAKPNAQATPLPSMGDRSSDAATAMIVSALDAALAPETSEWVLRPYLPAECLALFFGDYGTLKSFVALDMSFRVALGMPALGFAFAQDPQPVVYIMAEGKQGLPKRLKAWCQQNFPHEPRADVLRRSKLHFVRQPLNLSDSSTLDALVHNIETLGCCPRLIVVDTLSRNSDGEPERSNEAGSKYLNALDSRLRTRFGCTVLLIHHVGHTEKGRHRGPIVFAANTDAEIRVDRPDKASLDVTMQVVRLKDHDVPDPSGLRGIVVNLGERDSDGQPVTSLALEPYDCASSKRSGLRLGGKNQRALWARIETWMAMHAGHPVITFSEMTALAQEVDLGKHSARTAAIDGLITRGALVPVKEGYQVSE